MRRVLLSLLALAALAGVGRAEEPQDERRARDLLGQALHALEQDDAPRAVELIDQALEHDPQMPLLHFDRGYALYRSQRSEESKQAFRDALSAARDDERWTAEVGPFSLFNLGTVELLDGHQLWLAVSDEDFFLKHVRDQPSPTGQPQTPEGQEDAADQLRLAAARKGLEHAREAIVSLRDALRGWPEGRENVTRNLLWAQRIRKDLEKLVEELEERQREKSQENEQQQGDQKQQQPSDEQGDQTGSKSPEPDEQEDAEARDEQSGDSQQGDEEGGDEQQQSAAADSQESGDQNEAESTGKEPREMARTEALQELEKMLESAARRTRAIEAMRRAKLQRRAVEKDW